MAFERIHVKCIENVDLGRALQSPLRADGRWLSYDRAVILKTGNNSHGRMVGMAEAASGAVTGTEPSPLWVGRSVPRVEDAALLTGRGRYIDDLGVRPGTLQAAILRSPHAHAEIEAIDCQAARAADGVFAVLTGADVVALTSSFVVGIKAPIDCWSIATDRVRYVGEPVAVVVASDRYRAEDALDLIEVRYRPLPAVVDPAAAATVDS